MLHGATAPPHWLCLGSSVTWMLDLSWCLVYTHGPSGEDCRAWEGENMCACGRGRVRTRVGVCACERGGMCICRGVHTCGCASTGGRVHTPGSLPSCGFTLHEQVARVSLSGVSTSSDRLGAGSQKQSHGFVRQQALSLAWFSETPSHVSSCHPQGPALPQGGGNPGSGVESPRVLPPRPPGVTMSESLQVRLQLARPSVSGGLSPHSAICSLPSSEE